MTSTFSSRSLLSFVSCAAALAMVPTIAEANPRWSSSNVQLLRGWDYEVGDSQRTIFTFEHASGWEYGDNFLFIDYTNPQGSDDGTNLYGEFGPRLSFSKMSGNDIGFGPVSDVLLAGQIEMGEDIAVHLYGLGFDLDVPGFDFTSLNAYVRDDTNLDGSTWQVTLAWGTRFPVGSTNWLFKGHIDIAGEEGGKGSNINSAPQLLLDVGEFWGASDRLYAGLEYQYWQNKFGIDGVDEHNPQAMVLWKL